MRVVKQYQRQITQFISSSTPAAFIPAWGLLVVALAFLSALFFYTGAPAMNGRPWDTALFLEGAWRIANGQTPHRDFYSYLGVLPFYVTWLGMKLSHPCVSAITYGNVLLMVALGLSAMAVLSRRTSALYAAAMSLFLALLAVAPRPLGDPYDYTDYAMLYNRCGEALIGLFGTIIFIPPDPAKSQRWADWAEIAFAGALMTLLLFCKVNYFMMGVGFFGLNCLLGRFRLPQALFLLLSAGIVLGVISMITHIPPIAVIQDYRITAGAPDKLDRLRALAVHGIENVFYVPLLGLLFWEMASVKGAQKPSSQMLWKHGILMASIFGGALLLLTTNCQEGEMPLLALAGLYGAEIIRRGSFQSNEGSSVITGGNLGAVAILALLLVPTLATDCKTVLFAARDVAKKNWVSTETLQSTHLNDFRFVKDGTRSAEMRDYMGTLDESIQLLRRHVNPQMRLKSFMFSNPYPIALGLIPSEGGMVGLSNTSVVKRSHPTLKRMLGDGTHILVDDDGLNLMKDAYGAEWDALNLEIVEKTKNYVLFKIPEKSSPKLVQH